ncbi:MAG: sulfatase [Chloroflexota bacterium]|nr:sulfatase [Chloroflexota bacterium]
MTQHRPNVLYLHSHDTGRYVQPYGHAVPTPAYQRLAQEGVLFRQNFCLGPTCSPSRAALLTGQTPHSCGQLGLAHRGFELQHPERHLAWTLRHHGYATALVGVQHVVRNVPERVAATGYERSFTEGRNAAHVLPKTLELLREHAQGSRDRPFFMDIGFTETHRVFHGADSSASPAEDARYCLPPPVLPDTPETRQDMADFKASARVLDGAIGRILDALDEHGMADDTLVILTTDHGIAFPQMKCNLTDHGTGVLLILRGPAGVDRLRGGRVVDAMVAHLDVFPTVCEVAGVPPPDWLQGASLLPLAGGAVESLHETVFGEVNYHVPYEPQRSARTERWKYIRRYDHFGKPLLANCDDGPSKEVWLRHGWSDQDTAPEQLYDLVFDPQERHNVIGDDRYRAVADDMRGRLERWMRETDDPLLQGPIPLPPGAQVSPPELLSPRLAR